jgi:hypothetical protein
MSAEDQSLSVYSLPLGEGAVHAMAVGFDN